MIFPDFSFIFNVFIKINEYSKLVIYKTYHKVRELCDSITLESSLGPKDS